jgi:hypothetical protein
LVFIHSTRGEKLLRRILPPIKEFANGMSTGVSYFEQFVWDLEQRGVANIDIPVLIFGITA